MKSVQELSIHLYADGADRAGILDLYAKPYIKGLTTNPSLMKKAGIEVPGYPRIGPSGRILGPMGSSSQLGAVMVLFIACAVATAADGDDKWRRFAAITVVPMTAVLVLSGARAAWVGAGASVTITSSRPALRSSGVSRAAGQ